MRCFLLFPIIPTMLSIQLALFFSDVRFVGGDANFTKTPPSVLYVSEGRTAKFTWDYQVDDRAGEFRPYSPKWVFYKESASTPVDIAFDNKFNKWKWEIASTCPPRLLNPTRVSKESTATLVISNATAADSGIYECSLVFRLSQPKANNSKLIVTVRSQINITGETNVTEYTNLTLICSAVGPPIPNVIWLNDAGVVLTRGIQSAVLIIANITKEQNGTVYKCNATNNPNEHPVQKMITVTVKHPPKLNRSRSDNYTKACPDEEKHIKCAANGYPLPTYYWYNPNNKSVGENKTGVESEILVKADEGNWTCYITNGIGQGIYHHVQMKVLEESDRRCENLKGGTGLTTGEIVGTTIGGVAGVAIIAVTGVVIYKKKSAFSFQPRNG